MRWVSLITPLTKLANRTIAQGKALVRAIKALGTIKPSGSFGRALARLSMAAYKRRPREIVKVRPPE